MPRIKPNTSWERGRQYNGNKLWSDTVQPWLATFQPWKYKGTPIDTDFTGRTRPTTSWN